MDVLWFIYNMGMFALLTAGTAMLIRSAVRASRSGIQMKNVALAALGIAFFGGALIYWLNGTPLINAAIPKWYVAFGTLMIGYGGHGIMLWALDPVLAKKLLG